MCISLPPHFAICTVGRSAFRRSREIVMKKLNYLYFWKNTKIKGENYMGIFLHILFTHLNFMPFVDPEKTVLTKSHPATQPHTQLVQSLHSAKTDVTWITTKMNTFIIMHISAVQYNNMMKMVNDCWRLVTMSNKQHYTVNHLTTTSHTLRCNDMAHSSTNLNWLNHQQ